MNRDLRFALRMIAWHKWFSAAVIATLALGIGLNTMVFTLIDAVLFKPVPVPGGERLIAMLSRDVRQGSRGRQRMPISGPDFLYFRTHARSLEALEAGSGQGAILSEKDVAPEHYSMLRVTPGFFGMLHLWPVRGRDFAEVDGKPGAPRVALIGYGIWKDRYHGRDVIGRLVRVNGAPATIVGVMPEGVRFPDNYDMWMPIQPDSEFNDRSKRSLQLYGMLRPGVQLSQAVADFDVMSRRLAAEFPKEDKDATAVVQTFHQRFNGDNIQLVFSLMMAAVGMVLLIACANVANMLLARAIGRQREISIRAAIGASRWQIVRQLLVESLALSAIGGLAGFALAALGVHWFDLQTRDVGKPYWVQFAIDYRVFLYFSVICVLSAVLFGLAPALRASRADVSSTLKDGARSAGTLHGGRLSSALVVFQFGLTLVLLFGAGVFMRTLVDKQAINPRIPGRELLTARVNLPAERYKDAASRRRFFDELLARVTALPGVRAVAISTDLPGTGSGTRHIEIEGTPWRGAGDDAPSASVVEQSPGYLAAMNLPIVGGRAFNVRDGLPGQLTAVVTVDFARRFWPGKDPIGKRFRFHDKDKTGEWMSVAGVSADLEQWLDDAPGPLVFIPYAVDSYDSMALVVRTNNPAALIAPVRRAVQALDQDLPLFEVRTMAELAERQIWFLRLFGAVFTVFASIAMLMAAVGIYAVMAQAASGRVREIGVRMALGATPGRILTLVLKRGVWQLAAGLAIGVAAAVPAATVMRGLRFLDAPSDPRMFLGVALMLWTIGLFACWLPARRASALNPISAIREE